VLRSASALVAIALLATCTTSQPIDREVVVSGARFDSVRGETMTNVRTFIEAPDGQIRELAGAMCSVTSSLYSTELITPARLVLPSFGAQSPELVVSCSAGDLSGTTRVAVSTQWRYPPGYYGYPAVGIYGGTGGLGGAALGWGGWGYGAAAYPISQYPDVRLNLR
jgi:hypothetical protein